MANQMKEVADASLQVKRRKIDVQLKLFQEQMSYQRERDLRLYKTALLTHDNACLAILKQQGMVHCLQELTAVLGAGLSTKKQKGFHVPATVSENKAATTTCKQPANTNAEALQRPTWATVSNDNNMLQRSTPDVATNTGAARWKDVLDKNNVQE